MAISAIIRAHSLGILAGKEIGYPFNVVKYKMFIQGDPKELEFVQK